MLKEYLKVKKVFVLWLMSFGLLCYRIKENVFVWFIFCLRLVNVKIGYGE